MTDLSRIYLVGFMGSGKTTLGKAMARIINYNFVDLDELIINQTGKSISAIFREKGEESFRETEKEVLHSTLEMDNVIIATGGGTPCFYDNMEWMNYNGITVYLCLRAKNLVDNLLHETESRPLIAGKSREKLTEYISHKLNERETYYMLARYIIESPDTDPEGILKRIGLST